MTIKAVPVTAENFKPFGVMYEIDREHMRVGTGGWKAWTAPGDIMDDKCNIGITYAQNMPFKVDSMECHNPTQEVMVCGNKPIVLAVANSTPYPQAPGADPASIRAFIINPGQVVVINRSIWHDACRTRWMTGKSATTTSSRAADSKKWTSIRSWANPWRSFAESAGGISEQWMNWLQEFRPVSNGTGMRF